jgi:hypothetical protein
MNLFDAQEIKVPQALDPADFRRWQERMFSRLERVENRLFGQRPELKPRLNASRTKTQGRVA